MLPELWLRILQEEAEKKEKEAEQEEMSKVGFCFTGEGARGSVQAGIALGLERMGIKADFAIGISSGSVCSASYAHLGAEGMASMWSEIKNVFDVFGINWKMLWGRGLLNQKPMERIVRNAVLHPPGCESVVVRMNIEDGTMEYVSNRSCSADEFAEAVLGSVAITALVEDRSGWVDAGSRQIVPLEQCIEAGCKEIYVIMGRRFMIERWQMPSGFLCATKMAFRALDISLNEFLLRDINKCLRNEGEPGYKGVKIHLVEPHETPFESVEFNKCSHGVRYGTENFSISDRRGLLRMLAGPDAE